MITNLIIKTTEFFAGDPRRIQHFMKVYSYASLIGKMEQLDIDTQRILEAAAVVHDTGIKKAELLYGYNDGKLQEQYGPEAAKPILEACGFSTEEIDRICYLVGHHHTYSNVEGIDYRVLIEADFIVNMYEDNTPEDNIRKAYDRVFATESGKKLCRTIFNIQEKNNEPGK